MKKQKTMPLEVVHPYAAGIDVGAREHYVAVGQQENQVKRFGVFTSDHQELITWLKSHNITTVAMESTGSYWQTLFSAIQASGIDVLLTNSKHIKNPMGKTDVKDARWLQKLHTLGLLQGCFLPGEEVARLRQYYRHRTALLEDANRYIRRMQKALQLMNLRLEVVLSDISGTSGMRIIQAIIEGERNGEMLAQLAHKTVRKSRQEIAAALQGNWKPEMLYLLKDAYEIYHQLMERIKRCDQQIENTFEKMLAAAPEPDINLTAKKHQAKQVNVNVSRISYCWNCISYKNNALGVGGFFMAMGQQPPSYLGDKLSDHSEECAKTSNKVMWGTRFFPEGTAVPIPE